jgi:hypothetical protein
MERYDWSKATRGKHAARFPANTHAVVIEPEVYAAFGSAEAVNQALTLLLKLRDQLPLAKTKPKAKTSTRRRTKKAG